MNEALGSIAVPVLRGWGFTGSFPHFRRKAAAKTDLVTFQFNRGGGGFLLELGEGPATEFVTPWGKQVPIDRLTAWDLSPLERVRLHPGAGGSTEYWYRFDRGASAEEVAADVARDLSQANAWFGGAKSQPRIHGYSAGGAV